MANKAPEPKKSASSPKKMQKGGHKNQKSDIESVMEWEETPIEMTALPDAPDADEAGRDLGQEAQKAVEKEVVKQGVNAVAPGMGEVAEQTGMLDKALKR